MEPTKRQMPKQLAIGGKVISIEKIGEKTQAQFAAQLKQNGIVLEEERLKAIYNTLHDMAVQATKEAQANKEEVQEAEEVKDETKEVEPTNTEE